MLLFWHMLFDGTRLCRCEHSRYLRGFRDTPAPDDGEDDGMEWMPDRQDPPADTGGPPAQPQGWA